MTHEYTISKLLISCDQASEFERRFAGGIGSEIGTKNSDDACVSSRGAAKTQRQWLTTTAPVCLRLIALRESLHRSAYLPCPPIGRLPQFAQHAGATTESVCLEIELLEHANEQVG